MVGLLNRKERRQQERLARRGNPHPPTPQGLVVPQTATSHARPRIAICLPFEEQVYAKWVTQGLIPLMGEMTERDYVVTTEGSFIDTARRVLAEQALESDAEYLLWVDSDTIPSIGVDVISRLLSHGKDIVGSWYNVKKLPLHPCVYDYVDYDAAKDFHNYLPRKEAPSDENAPKCHCGAQHAQYIEKVDGLGFGTCLIHRRVFETIKEQWFSNSQGTEDLWFERLAKKYGFDTWVDWGLHSAHLGIAAY